MASVRALAASKEGVSGVSLAFLIAVIAASTLA